MIIGQVANRLIPPVHMLGQCCQHMGCLSTALGGILEIVKIQVATLNIKGVKYR